MEVQGCLLSAVYHREFRRKEAVSCVNFGVADSLVRLAPLDPPNRMLRKLWTMDRAKVYLWCDDAIYCRGSAPPASKSTTAKLVPADPFRRCFRTM